MDEDPHPAPDAQLSPEDQQKAREETAAHLRALIRFVCEQRLGAVPPELSALLPDERAPILLSRWYIAATSLSAEDLTALVRLPRAD